MSHKSQNGQMLFLLTYMTYLTDLTFMSNAIALL
jgi:hypothetical protein